MRQKGASGTPSNRAQAVPGFLIDTSFMTMVHLTHVSALRKNKEILSFRGDILLLGLIDQARCLLTTHRIGRRRMDDGLAYHGSELYCEEVPLAKIAQDVGHPCYIYSRRMLVEGYRALDQAFAGLPHLICYAMKANANLAILRVFLDEGVGWISSLGVSCFVLCAPGPMRNASCSPRARAPKRSRQRSGRHPAVQRGIPAGTRGHPSGGRQTWHTRPRGGAGEPRCRSAKPTRTSRPAYGRASSVCRFTKLSTLYRSMRALHHLDPVGVHAHIGSQITQVAPFEESLAKLVPLVKALRQDGFNIQYLDIGGGIGIRKTRAHRRPLNMPTRCGRCSDAGVYGAHGARPFRGQRREPGHQGVI